MKYIYTINLTYMWPHIYCTISWTHFLLFLETHAQLIDPSGKMVEYHEKHAREFGLHPEHHPLDWKTWYRDNKKPNIWKLVTKLYKEDIEKLGYSNEL